MWGTVSLADLMPRCLLNMDHPNLPNIMFLTDDQKHQTIEKIEAIQNLLYLIGVDACDPAEVRAYAYQAERLLMEMQTQILPGG